MADILAALEDLEEREAQAKEKNKRKGKKKLPQSWVSPAARRTRPRSPPPRPETRDSLHPGSADRRSPSRDSARRISFGETPRPTARPIWIPTKTESLASGFVYDPRLHKFGVSEAEWTHFSTEVIEVAGVPGPAWAWSFNRSKVIKKMKRELQYDGELKRLLRKWNKLFKRQGFQVSLELPVAKGEVDRTDEDMDTPEQKEKAERDAKRFRVVINGNPDRASSVYSRGSSLNRSVSGEATSVSHDKVPAVDDLKDGEGG